MYFVYWLESEEQVFCPTPPSLSASLFCISAHTADTTWCSGSISVPSSFRKICRFKFRHSETTLLYKLSDFIVHARFPYSVVCVCGQVPLRGILEGENLRLLADNGIHSLIDYKLILNDFKEILTTCKALVI